MVTYHLLYEIVLTEIYENNPWVVELHGVQVVKLLQVAARRLPVHRSLKVRVSRNLLLKNVCVRLAIKEFAVENAFPQPFFKILIIFLLQ